MVPQNFILKWISPPISQKEMEGLFSSINEKLISLGTAPILNSSQLSILPRSLPEEAVQIHFPVTFSSLEQAEKFRKLIWNERTNAYAISFVSEQVATTPKRLCVFDMDSTLIDQEVIDELARVKGFYDDVAHITEAAMRGEIDFTESLKRRVMLLKGMAFDDARSIIPHLTVSAGGEELLQGLQKQSIKTAIVSGGFEFILKHFQKYLFVDQVYAHNLLRDDDDLFTGEVEAPIVDAAYKQKLVANLKNNYSISLDETVCVGDGANDMLMMNEAGLSVSFAGKPKLSAITNTLILHRNLLWLKYLL